MPVSPTAVASTLCNLRDEPTTKRHPRARLTAVLPHSTGGVPTRAPSHPSPSASGSDRPEFNRGSEVLSQFFTLAKPVGLSMHAKKKTLVDGQIHRDEVCEEHSSVRAPRVSCLSHRPHRCCHRRHQHHQLLFLIVFSVTVDI